ncbi:MAG: hypothetical protein HYZ54_10200 [Ignavibacteriae bacterium]|nr:hypothetical protein [Ignavibacteriota bacterium]
MQTSAIKFTPMRTKKIRGHFRRFKNIEKWRIEHISLDISDYVVNQYDCYYAKIRIHPWSGLSLTNSSIPEPKRKTKQKILAGLLDIYDAWKIQLDEIGQPYYLKIWLFEPRFSQSQVVCAVENRIAYYENNFFKPDSDKTLKKSDYGSLQSRLRTLKWEYYFDEDYYDNSDIGKPEDYATIQDFELAKIWFAKLLQRPHRTDTFTEPICDIIESYMFKRGSLWIGGL